MFILLTTLWGQSDRSVKPDKSAPLHAKLAVIAKGVPVVRQSEIDTWKVILDRLSAKCPDETRDKVASLLITGHKILRDRDSDLDLKDVARLIDESIPPEGAKLLDCSTLYTTAVAREATGQPRLKKDKTPY